MPAKRAGEREEKCKIEGRVPDIFRKHNSCRPAGCGRGFVLLFCRKPVENWIK
jgi:hypothetical protein